MSKYHNRKVEIDGIKFDSIKEGERYLELKLLLKAGKIRDLQMQVEFELIPKQAGEQACKYKADFVYHMADTGKMVVEDVKGKRTREYIIKRKLMLWRHGIKIVEV
nr:MAG TPA: Endonuclease [Caudoviricetes sp.]